MFRRTPSVRFSRKRSLLASGELRLETARKEKTLRG